jgi:hypothetical protein
MHQGISSSVLFEIVFTQAPTRIATSEDVLFRADSAAGLFGKDVVDCESNLEVFDLTKVRPGSTPNTVLVNARFAGSEQIHIACRSDREPPRDNLGNTHLEKAYINPREIRQGLFEIDLSTRKLKNLLESLPKPK